MCIIYSLVGYVNVSVCFTYFNYNIKWKKPKCIPIVFELSLDTLGVCNLKPLKPFSSFWLDLIQLFLLEKKRVNRLTWPIQFTISDLGLFKSLNNQSNVVNKVIAIIIFWVDYWPYKNMVLLSAIFKGIVSGGYCCFRSILC